MWPPSHTPRLYPSFSPLNADATRVKVADLSALMTLSLDHNRFKGTIPAGISGMKTLRELRLDHNALTGEFSLVWM